MTWLLNRILAPFRWGMAHPVYAVLLFAAAIAVGVAAVSWLLVLVGNTLGKTAGDFLARCLWLLPLAFIWFPPAALFMTFAVVVTQTTALRGLAAGK